MGWYAGKGAFPPEIPYFDHVVFSPGGQLPPVAVEGAGEDCLGVALEGEDRPGDSQVPEDGIALGVS